jgi:hypothetical protein
MKIICKLFIEIKKKKEEEILIKTTYKTFQWKMKIRFKRQFKILQQICTCDEFLLKALILSKLLLKAYISAPN